MAAAEFSANALQNVLPNNSLIFTNSPVQATNGLIFHRDESGIFRLASPSRIIGNCGGNWNWLYGGCNCCNRMPEAMYHVSFHSNIALPTGGTVEAISLAISIDGSVDPSSTMIFTPAGSPVTGRYISNGYSGHSIEDRMIMALEQQMDEAKTDYERQLVEKEIQRLRRGDR